MNIHTTAVVRDRYQITIPDEIRRTLDWTKPKSVVSISITSDKELVIKPYFGEKKVDWDKIRAGIKLARSFNGKQGNLSEFIAEDRQQH